MARGLSQEPGASIEALDAARRGLHRTHVAALAQSRNRTVRETIAGRDDVPLGLQAALAQDAVTEVRSAIAANAHTVRSVLRYLSSDKNQAVLAALLANPNIPLEIVDGLAGHRRAGVRHLAIARLSDAARLPQVEATPDEDAQFPELRERATRMDVVEQVEEAREIAAPLLVAHEFAMVDMGADGISAASVTPPSLFAPPGAAPQPVLARTSPIHGLRIPATV